ncbi:MAG: hypothetical protein ACFB9N_17540 [Geitlerinemataceae cyanobacterium]
MSLTPNRVLLGISAGSVLTGLWCGRAIERAVRMLGDASEETLRGDRLPLLDATTRDSDLQPSASDANEP